MLLVERRLAIRQARVRISARHPREDPPLRQQWWRNWSWASAYIREWLYDDYYTKKCVHSYTKMCLIPRTRVFISKPKKAQEENKFLRQKIKESEDKTRWMIWKVMPRGRRSFHPIIYRYECDENWKKVFGIHFLFYIVFSFVRLATILACRYFLLDAGSHVTFGLATVLVYRNVPIGCSLPRDRRIRNFCCYQKVFYWTLLATIVTVYKL